MKVSVRIRGEWLAVPCGNGDNKVVWLGQESLKRYAKLLQQEGNSKTNEKIVSIRKTRGGAILEPSDLIKDVLNDEDFISVGK